MNVHIEFLAQLGHLAGGKHRSVPVDGPSTAQDVIRSALADDSPELLRVVFDATGELHRSVLLFVGDAQCDWRTPVTVAPGDTIVLAPPIAGG